MRRTLIVFFFAIVFWLAVPGVANAQLQDRYHKATIVEIVEETRAEGDQVIPVLQVMKVRLPNDEEVLVEVLPNPSLDASLQFSPGDTVVVVEQFDAFGDTTFSIVDHYRIPTLQILLVLFLICVIVVARAKGIASVFGMAVSFGILIQFVLPAILDGKNPLIVVLLGSVAISAITIYLSHGFSMKSHVALGSILVTLVGVLALSVATTNVAKLSGLGSEEAIFVQFGESQFINMHGLFLGGILLATISILDDISVSQVSVVFQLAAVNRKLSLRELFRRAMAVGSDHISSLVNTLILAYAGASLPLFILFTTTATQPLWVALNDQLIAEEIVRTVIGSIGLIVAVPITTFTASYMAKLRPGKAT